MKSIRHFLDLDRLDTITLRAILDLAGDIKRSHLNGQSKPLFSGKTLVMIFEKPSTRTRVSFEVGMKLLNGDVVILDHADSQLGRGESLEDTIKGFKGIADGEYDDLPEAAFYMVGTIEEAVEKAEKMAKDAAA